MPPIRKSSGSGDGRQNAIPASAERLQFQTQLVAILGNTQFIHGGASDTFQFSLGGPSASADLMSQKLISELEEPPGTPGLNWTGLNSCTFVKLKKGQCARGDDSNLAKLNQPIDRNPRVLIQSIVFYFASA